MVGLGFAQRCEMLLLQVPCQFEDLDKVEALAAGAMRDSQFE